MNPKHKALKKKKEDDEYEMPRKEAISEHKRLLEILKRAKSKGTTQEYKIQKKELKKIKKEKED